MKNLLCLFFVVAAFVIVDDSFAYDLRGKVLYSANVSDIQVGTESDNDGHNAKASGVSVEASLNDHADRTWTGVTDNDGFFILQDVAFGDYNLRLDGRFQLNFSVQEPTTEADRSRTFIDLPLILIPSPAPAPAPAPAPP